ncbi:undecaprenyl-diphosphatase [Litorimonas cladophorae]|uniref:Undecaprenyl-diphosphatase n=1 Tax=Litorimonas cladophorae TaxID=1220491 RepID=A0A918KK39_9PROT|nr:undecaprenyl-diphosphate phosphatase [Litorimonas cladophorae]GGX65991.1 undecaprenyl-diphosphatase [Litorimonas cladophorae]
MSWLQLILLSLIQGLTEFLPISSSAHLILPAQILGWPDQGPLIDVMAHFGSLFAVLLYFRKDVASILGGLVDLLQRKLNTNSALALNLILSTPPALLAGFLLASQGWDDLLRSPLIIAFTTIVFGVLLWVSDVKAKSDKPVEALTWGGAVTLGLAQSLALIPGTSRSGITMTAGRALGLSREAAARFSMLMSLPIIGAGGLYAMLKLMSADATEQTATLGSGLVVALLSFMTAYACIALFMKWVGRIGFFPFMVYRLFLGAGLLIWIFA